MEKTRVLIIDDDKVLQDLLALYLKVEGFKVLKAADGRDGLQRLRDERVDLVLLDLMMPAMDGMAFVRALKETESPPRVLVLSAAGFGLIDRDLRAAGVRGVVRKPVAPADLVRHVRDALAGPV